MTERENQEDEYFLVIKIVQAGTTKSIPLNDLNLEKRFKEIYEPLLKSLKMKRSDAFLSDESGRMIGPIELNLTLKEILEKYGTQLSLYYEKVM